MWPGVLDIDNVGGVAVLVVIIVGDVDWHRRQRAWWCVCVIIPCPCPQTPVGCARTDLQTHDIPYLGILVEGCG